MSFTDTSVPQQDEEEFVDDEDLALQPEGEQYQDEEEEEASALGDVTVEDRAKALGWKPLPEDPENPQPHEYRGDPRKWTPPQEFIDRGERELPVLRESLRRTGDKLARQDRELETLRKTVGEQAEAIRIGRETARRADERGYQRALGDLKRQQREAVATGDTEVFDQVQEQIDAMEDQRREELAKDEPAPAPEPKPVEINPAITAFVDANPWFHDASRPYLKTAMISMHQAVINQYPEMAETQRLKIAREKMSRAYPEIGGDEVVPQNRDPAPREQRQPVRAAAPRSAAPRSGDLDPPRRGAGSAFDQIADPTERAEAKAAYATARRHDPDMTEAEYVEIYMDPHADVLDLQRKHRKGAK